MEQFTLKSGSIFKQLSLCLSLSIYIYIHKVKSVTVDEGDQRGSFFDCYYTDA